MQCESAHVTGGHRSLFRGAIHGRCPAGPGPPVRLIPAQFVKPFLSRTRTTFSMPRLSPKLSRAQNMRFVPIKTDDQLDLQALHRVRDRLVHHRTAVIKRFMRPVSSAVK